MNDKFKELDERFDEWYRITYSSDADFYIDSGIRENLLDFIHSEIEKAEKKAFINGARKLSEKLRGGKC